MSHPDVLACDLATELAGIQSAALDNRVARSQAALLETLTTSRDAIAHSRDVLARFANR
jgi:hypothetical protein